MSPRIAVLGAGAMGASVTKLLARHDDVEILVLDVDGERASAAAAAVGSTRAEARAFDAEATGELAGALRGAGSVAACLPYRLNLTAMRAALDAGVPYSDLGGLFHMTRRQLELDGEFRAAGLPAVIGIGACPGLSNVMARLASQRLDAVDAIDIVDGSVDPSLTGFAVPYSAETILDELDLPAMVFEDGELREVPAGSGAVDYEFPDPVGRMEAVYTLHSELATLPTTIPGVRDVRWRLALPPEVIGAYRALVELGLASRQPVALASGDVVPRELLLALLRRLPAPSGPPADVEFLDVRATGTVDGAPASFLGRSRFDPRPEGIGGGPFGTSAPIAVAARWLAGGRVPPGVHPPEDAFDPEPFLEGLAAEGVAFEVVLEV